MFFGSTVAAAALAASVSMVPRADISAAMRAPQGYDPAATTNSGRFQLDVYRALVADALRLHLDKPLFLAHEDWFAAFLESRGITADAAPLYAKLANEHAQDTVIEFHTERVVEKVVQGPPLRQALAVATAWPDTKGAPDEYSFEDLFSRPALQVTNHQRIEYRVLMFDDRVVVDQIQGLTGRPSSGALGLLFKLIGEGRVLEYRMALAPDGTQVSRGRAKKGFFEVASTVTVAPDGRAEKDVPDTRPDLQALDQRLQEPLEIRYRPLALTVPAGER